MPAPGAGDAPTTAGVRRSAVACTTEQAILGRGICWDATPPRRIERVDLGAGAEAVTW